MACQPFGADSFSSLAPELPILMHHASTSDCLSTGAHTHSMVSAVSSGLSLGQSKRSHMHLSTTPLGNAPSSLHYPVAPCHYGNQQTYGMMTAQEMLSASISQTRILQTCGVPHPNMVSTSNPLQGTDKAGKNLAIQAST
uniref:Uncharacterized protein n=1 Tax=Knipowitschia caucasica TaxID=637954 RepID=A0AAV2K4I3_KNICA